MPKNYELDLVKEFEKIRKPITSMICDLHGRYVSSTCRKLLENRYITIRNSNDMRFNTRFSRQSISTRGDYQSEIAIPLVLERTKMMRSTIRGATRTNPIVTVAPLEGTPRNNANALQMVLQENFRKTQFRRFTWLKHTDFLAKFGTSVNFTHPVFGQRTKMAVEKHPLLGEMRKMVVTQPDFSVNNQFIHLLNYYQNPEVDQADFSDYAGHMERLTIAELYTRIKASPEAYIKESVMEAIEKHKEGFEDKDYWTDDEDNRSYGRSNSNHIDLLHFWGKLPINGNEASGVSYYAQLINKKIIRFQVNPYGSGINPYTVLNGDKRTEYFWGNCTPEYVIPHENYLNLLLSASADQAMKAMKSYIFLDKASGIHPSQLAMQPFGGIVQFESKGKNIGEMFAEFAPKTGDLNGIDWTVKQVQDSARSLTVQPDLNAAGTQRGIANSTATAANILDSQASTQVQDILESIGYDLASLGKTNADMTLQYFPTEMAIRQRPDREAMIITMDDIMGEYEYEVESTVTRNQAERVQRINNLIASLMNYKGTGDPSLAQANIVPLIREVIKEADIVDVDDVLPEMQEQPMQQPGMPVSPELGGMSAGTPQPMAP